MLIVHETEETLERLAKCVNSTVPNLYLNYMGQVLDSMELPSSSSKQCWAKSDPSRLLFDAICRRGNEASAEQIGSIVPVLLLHLSTESDTSFTPDPSKIAEGCDADVKIAFLALFETMLGNDTTSKSFVPFASELIVDGLLPNIVWKGGRVAATIRKLSIACLYTLLRQQVANRETIFSTAPKVLPLLKSVLDDTDLNTRQLTVLSLQYLFTSMPKNSLGEEPVEFLYPALLERLDDSNDSIRLGICKTFKMFLQASYLSPNTVGAGNTTMLEYTLDTLFVHLDDPEVKIQEAVYEVLVEIRDTI